MTSPNWCPDRGHAYSVQCWRVQGAGCRPTCGWKDGTSNIANGPDW